MAKSAYEEWKMIYRVALEHIWKSKRPELRRVEMLLYCLDLECSAIANNYNELLLKYTGKFECLDDLKENRDFSAPKAKISRLTHLKEYNKPKPTEKTFEEDDSSDTSFSLLAIPPIMKSIKQEKNRKKENLSLEYRFDIENVKLEAHNTITNNSNSDQVELSVLQPTKSNKITKSKVAQNHDENDDIVELLNRYKCLQREKDFFAPCSVPSTTTSKAKSSTSNLNQNEKEKSKRNLTEPKLTNKKELPKGPLELLCSNCKDYYKVLNLSPKSMDTVIKMCSKHTRKPSKVVCSDTPPGFWDITMPKTPEQ